MTRLFSSVLRKERTETLFQGFPPVANYSAEGVRAPRGVFGIRPAAQAVGDRPRGVYARGAGQVPHLRDLRGQLEDSSGNLRRRGEPRAAARNDDTCGEKAVAADCLQVCIDERVHFFELSADDDVHFLLWNVAARDAAAL